MNYLKLLLESYERAKLMECPPSSRVEFLAVHLFGFTTYDAELDALFGKKALEVFQAISERSTLEYIKDSEQYRWYITMCNMPFFAERLYWGASIRGAWWSSIQPPVESSGLFMNGEQVSELVFGAGESVTDWKNFCSAVIEFSI